MRRVRVMLDERMATCVSVRVAVGLSWRNLLDLGGVAVVERILTVEMGWARVLVPRKGVVQLPEELEVGVGAGVVPAFLVEGEEVVVVEDHLHG